MLSFEVDVVILGGGIGGLWLLNRLHGRGYNAVLIETGELGGGQSVNSQGMIHGGIKYALGGALTGNGTWHSDDRSKKRVWNGMFTIVIDPARLGTPNMDAYGNAWAIAWVARQLGRDPAQLFDANMFHPWSGSLAYAESLIPQSLAAWPVLALGGSPLLAYKAEAMKRRDWTPMASVDLVAKDLDLALDAARAGHIPLPLTAMVRQIAAGFQASGEGGLDFFRISDWPERMAPAAPAGSR